MTRHMLIKNNKGFTLVEMLMYLGLYAIVMTGTLVGAYSLFESSVHNQARAMVQEEGTFILGKIDWVLSNTREVQSPTATGTTLHVKRFDDSLVTVDFDSGYLRIAENGEEPQRLNNTHSVVSNVLFMHTLESSEGTLNMESVRGSFTIRTHTRDGKSFERTFSTLKYLRK